METDQRLDGEKVLRSGMVDELEALRDGLFSQVIRVQDKEVMLRKLAAISEEMPEVGLTEAETSGLERIKKLLADAVLFTVREEKAAEKGYAEEAYSYYQMAIRGIDDVIVMLKLLFEKISDATVDNELDVTGALDFRERALAAFGSADMMFSGEDVKKLEAMKEQLTYFLNRIEEAIGVMGGEEKDERAIYQKGARLKELGSNARDSKNTEALLHRDVSIFNIIMLNIKEAGGLMELFPKEQIFTQEPEIGTAASILKITLEMLKPLIGRVDIQLTEALRALSVKTPELFIRNQAHSMEHAVD